MGVSFTAILSILILFYLPQAALAQAPTGKEFTIVAGGGNAPFEATELLVKTAGGSKSRILVITWAAEENPQRSADAITQKLERHHPQSIHYSLHPPSTPDEAKEFLEQLKQVDGVYFSGGKQRRILMPVNHFKEIEQALLTRYAEGMPILGTSAGGAMQGKVMIADGPLFKRDVLPQLEKGLGLLPEGVIPDTHFFARSRWKRMVPVVEKYSGLLGLGIDEDGAAVVRGKAELQVLGTHPVMVMESKHLEPAIVYELRPGDRLNLNTRQATRIQQSTFRQCLLYPLQLLLGK